MTDELRNLLRESAEAHRPDRARILARMERGTTRPEPRPRPHEREHTRSLSWPKVVLATLATAGALAVSSFAVATIVHHPDPPQTTIAMDPAPSASPSAAVSPNVSPPSASTAPEPSRTPSRSATGGPAASGSPSIGPPSTPPTTGTHTEDGPLWADGSVDPHSTVRWSQSNITLKTRSTLTALTIELRVAMTDGVKNAGSRQAGPAADFALSVHEDGRFLVYRWTLKPGRTVPAGQHLFAGQYNHATGGRDAKDDTYRAEATTTDGTAVVWGDFARTS
ncbi:hypothetical protein WKI68_42075 [Streptomyces sp. MS1.HAVA.3]|uniref:Uncharacterized protein n=1 Tax=Streptomyces caledonius TaxID=3134107 RepID=A0ABU8UEI1_9ACTN